MTMRFINSARFKPGCNVFAPRLELLGERAYSAASGTPSATSPILRDLNKSMA